MSHYKSNLRDVEFNLFEVLGREEVLGTGPFAEVDEETARDMLAEVNRLALGPVADSFVDSDRNPPVFDPATGDVTMPESFKKSYRALMDAEWWRLSVPPELGGTVVPQVAPVGGRQLHPRGQPRPVDVLQRADVRDRPVAPRHPRAEAVRRAGGRARVGRDDGADRA